MQQCTRTEIDQTSVSHKWSPFLISIRSSFIPQNDPLSISLSQLSWFTHVVLTYLVYSVLRTFCYVLSVLNFRGLPTLCLHTWFILFYVLSVTYFLFSTFVVYPRCAYIPGLFCFTYFLFFFLFNIHTPAFPCCVATSCRS